MNTDQRSTAKPNDLLPRLRNLVLVIWTVGLLGTGAELMLLGHTEGIWQLVPLILILCGLLALGWYAVAKRRYSVRIFQTVLLLFIVGGISGTVLHFRGKMEFKRETNPRLAGWELLRETMKGAVPPIIAPAALIHFGLLGLACMFRHPTLNSQAHNTNSKE